jgi:hypothetical protein
MAQNVIAKCFVNGTQTDIKRPAGQIVAKGQLKERTRTTSFLCIGDELFLSYETDRIDGNFGIQKFSTRNFELLAELVGLGGVLIGHEQGETILASGLNALQSPASTYFLDLDLNVLAAIPLRYPYQSWGGRRGQVIAHVNDVLDDFYLQMPLKQPDTSDRSLIPSIIPDLSFLKDVGYLVSQPIRVDLLNHSAQRLLEEDLAPETFGVFTRNAIAPKSGIICYCTLHQLQAIQIETGQILWRRSIPKNPYGIYVNRILDINPEETLLAINDFPNNEMDSGLVLINLHSGECVYPISETPKALRYKASAIKWHPTGWLAIGYSSGELAHLFPDRKEIHIYNGTRRKIFSIAFIDDAKSLIIGTIENHLRRFELSPDEV